MKERQERCSLRVVLLSIAAVVMMCLPVFAANVTTNIHEYLEAYYAKRYSIADVQMGGTTYEQALCFNSYNSVAAEANFNLEGHFKSMTFYAAHEDSKNTLAARTVKMYADDKLVYEYTVENGALPKAGSISLQGVKQLRIWVSGSSGSYRTCIGGIQIVSDGFTRDKKLEPVTSNLLTNVQAYNSNRYSVKDEIMMCDKVWEDVLCFNTFNSVTGYANFNLEGNYKKLTFYAGHSHGSDANNRSLTVYGDSEKVLYETVLAYNQLMVPVTVDVTGVHQLKIQVGGSGGSFNTVIAGADLVSNGIMRSVSLDQEALIFNDNNKSAYLKATIVPPDATNPALTWSSSDTSVATVNSEGLVTGVGPGDCTITVKTVSGGYTASCQVSSTVTKIEKIANTITASNLSFTAKSKAQSKAIGAGAEGGAQLTYVSNNSKVKVSATGKVTVAKNFAGIAVITIRSSATERYKAAQKKVKVTVTPATPVIGTCKNTGKKRFTVKWTKQAGITGYQVQYSLKTNFSKKTTKTIKKAATKSLTVKKLKVGKKYYVRIRSYVKVGSKTLYSQWSRKKSVKIKK